MISPHAKAPDISAALDLIEGTKPSDWNDTDLTFIQAISDLQRFATSLQITLTEQAMQISGLNNQIARLQTPDVFWHPDDAESSDESLSDLIQSTAEMMEESDVIEISCGHFLPSFYVAFIWNSETRKAQSLGQFDNHNSADAALQAATEDQSKGETP